MEEDLRYSDDNCKRPRLDKVDTPHPEIKVEPQDSQWTSRTAPPPSRGQVTCGHCRIRRASVCCMEEPCVLFAERRWQMTAMFVCPQCDSVIHNNPVMSDHFRTPLLVRGLTVCIFEDLPQNSDPATEGDYNVFAATTQDIETTPSRTSPQRTDDGTVHPVSPNTFLDASSNTDAAENSSTVCNRESVSLGNLNHVHKRYAIVLEHHLSHPRPLLDTFKQTNVPRQTLMDTLALAELKIIDPGRYEEFLDSVEQRKCSSRVADMEKACRAIIKESYKEHLPCLRGSILLPIHVSVYD